MSGQRPKGSGLKAARRWRSGTYADVAAEYYDPARHPTCRNFRDGSRLLMHPYLSGPLQSDDWLCEVGPGDSIVAEVLRDRRLDCVVLLDVSIEMISHSLGYRDRGAHLVIADARKLPFGDESMLAVVASLGDPYNDATFWLEAKRVLKPGGVCLFTTPSFEWATTFREDEATSARFELRTGEEISVPSFVLDAGEQTRMIEDVGLAVADVRHVTVGELPRPISPKLTHGTGDEMKAVTLYVAGKP